MRERPIRPALTEDQWLARYAEYTSTVPRMEVSAEGGPGKSVTVVHGDETIEVPPELVHPLAALCLAEEPFGFTRTDADRLREVAEDLPPARAAWLESVAARILAIAPPEGK
jgi:hypothetical protein